MTGEKPERRGTVPREKKKRLASRNIAIGEKRGAGEETTGEKSHSPFGGKTLSVLKSALSPEKEEETAYVNGER